MTTMIGKVARAIDPGAWVMFPEDDYPAEIRRKESRKVVALDQARAAIEAMREPTEAMLSEGDKNTPNNPDVHDLNDIYRAMIDAALAEEEPK